MLLHSHIKFWLNFLTSSPKKKIIQLSDKEQERLENYLRLNTFEIPREYLKPVNSVSPFKKSYYSYDWYRIFSTTDTRLCFHAFGDINKNLDYPGLTKSRPISLCSNNVLLPLETARHFDFVEDNRLFTSKFDQAVWRGAAYQKHRQKFLQQTSNSIYGDFADTSHLTKKNKFTKPQEFMSIQNQLNYKFIVSLEGNDVASNLKWIMASNSIAIMPKPKMETWFSERHLVANQHYIEISDDFTNIDEKIEYFLEHPKECKEINAEAKRYCEPFFDLERQYQLGMIVADRYFESISTI